MISSDFASGAGIYTKQLAQILTSSLFLRCLENLTGIHGLLPDPHLHAGGLHQYTKGGFLEIHTDFYYYPRFNLFRRVNLLLYLNKGWQEEYNGSLILCDRAGQNSVRIFPGWNQMVIANIGHNAYHGFPTPVDCPDEMTRKSLAVWYYTAQLPLRDLTEYFFCKPHFKGQEQKLGTLRLIMSLIPPVVIQSIRSPKWAVGQFVPPAVLHLWYKLTGR